MLTQQSLPPVKRKRSDSNISEAPTAKARCDEDSISPSLPAQVAEETQDAKLNHPTQSSVNIPCPAAPVAERTLNTNMLRETLTGQIGLEVLLKHQEMRQIDQEIAKCQIALEQLRRCAEIPFPGSTVTGPSLDVSNGVGPSLPKHTEIQSPAPWGVTEGPYTRHYARWLLSDPRFDDARVLYETGPSVADPSTAPAMAGRTTRNSRSTRALGNPPTETPSTHPTTGPKLDLPYVLIHRDSDNTIVKLVCPECKVFNFASAQGFINHTRLSHNRRINSHQHAADECGQPPTSEEINKDYEMKSTHTKAMAQFKATKGQYKASMLPGAESLYKNPQRPQRKSHKKVQPAPLAEPETKFPSGSVHPLVFAPDLKRPNCFETPAEQLPSTGLKPSLKRRRPETTTVNASFTPSMVTPHLSALIESKGVGLDMAELIKDAKCKIGTEKITKFVISDEAEVKTSKVKSTKIVKTSRAARTSSVMETCGKKVPITRETCDEDEPLRVTTGGKKMVIDRKTGHQTLQTTEPTGGKTCYLNKETGRKTVSVKEAAGAQPSSSSSGSSSEVSNSWEPSDDDQAPSLVSDDEDDCALAYDAATPSPEEMDAEEFRIQVGEEI
ncbi:hypothetical protein N7495_005553 [Penicillium taxi]|uniref:uncharacterized protein n=1 Tax=Penicillium taxi TaxID=168475 RepID=UPI0025450BCC|nr:uncharacterized protein N7495_005553 [Penicillium taxi]KAJ5893862.1 hypothetical protein N7495_005553 [Penicillium taxi]